MRATFALGMQPAFAADLSGRNRSRSARRSRGKRPGRKVARTSVCSLSCLRYALRRAACSLCVRSLVKCLSCKWQVMCLHHFNLGCLILRKIAWSDFFYSSARVSKRSCFWTSGWSKNSERRFDGFRHLFLTLVDLAVHHRLICMVAHSILLSNVWSCAKK